MSQVLQRYMDLPKFISLLQTKKLYLAKMSSFEDALEGGLTVSNFFGISNEHKWLDMLVNYSWPSSNESEEERKHSKENIKNRTEEINNRMFSTPFGSYPCCEGEQVFPRCREWIYVSCWHASDHECSAMWRLYGGDKNAVCIFSSEEKLLSAVKASSLCDNLELNTVNYICYAHDEFEGEPLDPFISKSKPYSFEKEVRLMSWNSKIDLLEKEQTNPDSGLMLDIDLGKAIERIVISPYADLWFKSIIQKVCSDAQLDVAIEESSIQMSPVRSLEEVMSYGEKHGLR
ncbi:DUF2971 domain-containing protein [Pseudoalteromonas rubra]|uniref:DUF2971 domain-containing protein n=1 Tax=Pseudoalteromonas rubra TaxID=43658 RepID=UPI000F7B850A|nr:DUF2971 domain-containing protein [Pseudoalteromonas rubra]